MTQLSKSEARRLLGLPATGRVSSKRLKEARDSALRRWSTELSSSISSADRQRARDVLSFVPVAYDNLRTGVSTPPSRARKTNTKPSMKSPPRQQSNATDLLDAYRQFQHAIDGTSAVLQVPKFVIILVLLLAISIMVQSCAHHFAAGVSNAQKNVTKARREARR